MGNRAWTIGITTVVALVGLEAESFAANVEVLSFYCRTKVGNGFAYFDAEVPTGNERNGLGNVATPLDVEPQTNPAVLVQRAKANCRAAWAGKAKSEFNCKVIAQPHSTAGMNAPMQPIKGRSPTQCSKELPVDDLELTSPDKSGKGAKKYEALGTEY